MGQRHTLVHRIADWAERKGSAPAIWGKDAAGNWQSRSWSQYWQDARDFAKGLIALGHSVGDCVAIVGDNRPEWVVCQFGIMAARGVPAPIYTTNTTPQAAYIVSHCRGKIAICDKQLQLDKYLEASAAGDIDVETIITMDDISTDNSKIKSLSSIMELGREQDDAELDKRLEELTEDETALLIYTSGTTGVPKAVTLSHHGMIFVGERIAERFEFLQEEGIYKSLSYLPLCHVAEQIFTNIAMLDNGGQVYFCPDLKLLKDYLAEVKPNVFLGVPRVWEKFEAALKAKLGQATGIKAKLTAWAQKTELAGFEASVAAGEYKTGFGRKMANKLVISKVKSALGLEDLKLAATGAAPISADTQRFFAGLGICIYEGYGMSETSGVATVNDFLKPKFGSVGQALRGVEVRIAEDGEILLKGPNMTKGYLHMPDETAELLDDEGWLHTGDVGELDAENNLKITGRKKDLLITAGGKNVAPAEMEAHIKTITGVGQAVVVGDRQPYLCALIALDPDALADLCNEAGIEAGSIEQIAANDKLKSFLEGRIEERCNARVARYQTIKKFKVLPTPFTVETGEITPTMKLKRNVVNKKFSELIDGMYN